MPDAPTGLSATYQSQYDRVWLNWAYTYLPGDTIRICRNTTGSPTWQNDEIDWVSSGWNYYDSTISAGITYYYRVIVKSAAGNYSGYSNEASVHVPGDYSASTWDALELQDATEDVVVMGASGSDTVTVTDAETIAQELSASASDTVTVTDSTASLAVTSLDLDFRYYMGSADGKVYAEDMDFTSDDGYDIEAYWISKDADFTDEYPMYLDTFLSIYKIKLWYVDLKANSNISIEVSVDGGSTWTTQVRTLGTGDETVKSADYFFIKTSDKFMFKVGNNSSADKFQWIGLEVQFTPRGKWFEVS